MRGCKRLPKYLKKQLVLKENIFKSAPFHQSLRTHKLQGNLHDYYAFSLNRKYRVIFGFIEKDISMFFFIGTHDIYD